MSAFRARAAALTGTSPERIERLAGGDLSEVVLLRRPDGRCTVAKHNRAAAIEAAMLRTLAEAGAPTPAIEGECDDVLLLERVEHDGVFSPAAWRTIGTRLRHLHRPRDEPYGWAVDYQLGTVGLPNRQTRDWPAFWGEQRLTAVAAILDRPIRDRISALAERLRDHLPSQPPAVLLHGDLWSGNILVAEGRLVALIDPACCYGDPEVDLAMLDLFDTPPDEFWQAYGPLRAGWEQRRPLYQLFPALVHLRLFGASYAGLVERLLERTGA